MADAVRPDTLPRPNGPGRGGVRLRRFGTDRRDLEINLWDAPRPQVLTAILAGCMRDVEGRPIGGDVVWNMPVSSRIAWLLALADLEGEGPFRVPLRCPSPGCREAMDIELSLAEVLATDPGGAAEAFSLEAGGARIVLRRPTGADQMVWLREAYPPQDAPRAILASLIVAGPNQLTEGQVSAIEEALDEADPLLRFTVTTECPSCGLMAEHEAPLADCALEVLYRAQQRLIEEVHALAGAYGWREAEVLALPSWRRARYLALLASEGRA